MVELNALRLQRRLWRVSALVCVICITVASMLVLRSSAARLLESGPARDEFVAQLNREMSRQVFPRKYDAPAGYSVGTGPTLQIAMPLDESPVPAVSDVAPKISEMVDAGESGTIRRSSVESRLKTISKFRMQTVAEYQSMLNKIIDDLTVIRQAERGNVSGGLPVNTVAVLLVGRIQDAIQTKPLENRGWATGEGTSEGAE
jgi:hypothetical protein